MGRLGRLNFVLLLFLKGALLRTCLLQLLMLYRSSISMSTMFMPLLQKIPNGMSQGAQNFSRLIKQRLLRILSDSNRNVDVTLRQSRSIEYWMIEGMASELGSAESVPVCVVWVVWKEPLAGISNLEAIGFVDVLKGTFRVVVMEGFRLLVFQLNIFLKKRSKIVTWTRAENYIFDKLLFTSGQSILSWYQDPLWYVVLSSMFLHSHQLRKKVPLIWKLQRSRGRWKRST